MFILPILLSVAFITLMERKVLSLIGFRIGPNKVSFFGVFQPVADAVKLSNKSVNYLYNFSFFFYYLSSIFIILISIIIWLNYPSNPLIFNLKYSILIIILILGFNSFNSILSGWRIFGKFSLIGRIRRVAQLISYEVVIYLCLFFFIVLIRCFRFSLFRFFNYLFLIIVIPYCFYIWLPSVLAELNRTPYDFSEGERELVSGFNTDYGSLGFTFIFLAEYSNILFLSSLTSFLFFKNFIIFFFITFFFVIWIRSVLPRFRFDKLIILAWKFFIPFLTIIFCIFMLEIYL